MQVIEANSGIKIEPCVATVGFFDGVHIGHRFLMEELKKIASTQHLKSVVVTFDQHPRKVLNADFQPKLLTTLDERLFQIGSTGVDACVVLNFTREMSLLSARDFLKEVLHDQLNVQTLLVGHDHRFGHNREDGLSEYIRYGEEFGIKVIEAQRFATEDMPHISSSVIRRALLDGDVETANRLLMYEYSFEGKVVNGFKVGHKIGFPTANLIPLSEEKLIPGVGVYAVRARCNEKRFKAMMDIGYRPTFGDDNKLTIEVHIIDFNEDIYKKNIRIDFIRRLRNEIKFDTVEELIEQLYRDREEVLAMNF
ncbi:MAG: bifunctional riboflavin kinase/FAD synthetase [Paludibacteraceae bacterium]|nr:bifunctional riboflavin kinase/FAD synthetase [Paludibacteraceae bacterium]MBP8966115.1 bifunctional riboflavin kinase/FAD synthetase [Paludibacteraceae bacterium]OPZ02905.1 MAG: Riboflavin biosynthesis protein RibF [Bacteroidetes bacterium ADurb.BinA395]